MVKALTTHNSCSHKLSDLPSLRKNLLKSIWNKKNLYWFSSLRELFFVTKKNIFGSNVYFFTLKTHLLKVMTLFVDLNMIVLIVNTFSLRLQNKYKFSLSVTDEEEHNRQSHVV